MSAMPLLLAVDDSRTVRMIVGRIFRERGCTVIEAENGREGWDAANRVRPDLILLDITMPVMDGVELLTRLKSDRLVSGIPVVMLTAESGRSHIDRVIGLGASAYVLKPFKPLELVRTVGRCLELAALVRGETIKPGLLCADEEER